jgi:hypothetical protein
MLKTIFYFIQKIFFSPLETTNAAGINCLNDYSKYGCTVDTRNFINPTNKFVVFEVNSTFTVIPTFVFIAYLKFS